MKSCLFVLHEGIPSTIFRSQVFEHCVSMKKEGIKFDILSHELFKKMWGKSLENKEKYGGGIDVFLKKGVNPYFPFSILINALIFFFFIRYFKKKYNLIHARSDYSAFICLIVRPFHQIPVVWDCRGDSYSELDYAISKKSFIFRAFIGGPLLLRQKIIIRVVRKYSNGAVFVSNALMDEHSSMLTRNRVVIPCSVPSNLFYFKDSLRESARIMYSLQDNKRVYLYSGSLVSYQAIDLQKEAYRKILDHDQHNVIILATTDDVLAHEIFKEFLSDRFFIIKVNYDDMNAVYNMSDFAIMLRDKMKLNWVASPTKFGEYCMSGLPVIMNNTVSQAVDNSKSIGNYIDVDNIVSSDKFNDEDRASISNASNLIYSKDSVGKMYAAFYEKMLVN